VPESGNCDRHECGEARSVPGSANAGRAEVSGVVFTDGSYGNWKEQARSASDPCVCSGMPVESRSSATSEVLRRLVKDEIGAKLARNSLLRRADELRPGHGDRTTYGSGAGSAFHAVCDWIPNIWLPVFYGIRDFDLGEGAPAPFRVLYPSLGTPSGGVSMGFGQASDPEPLGPAQPPGVHLQGAAGPESGFDLGNLGPVGEFGVHYGESAPPLTCATYPVILFHVECSDPYHHRRWTQVLAPLARSGYVVIIAQPGPFKGGPADDPYADAAEQLLATLYWTFLNWQYGGILRMGSIGVAGWGIGVRGAAELMAAHLGNPAWKAFASLGGFWKEWWFSDVVLPALDKPSLFMCGVPYNALLLPGGSGVDPTWVGEPWCSEPHDTLHNRPVGWHSIGQPKHFIAYGFANYGDYLPPGEACGLPLPGFCAEANWRLIGDTLAHYFSKYMPPTTLHRCLSSTLVCPVNQDLESELQKMPLSDEQREQRRQYFAGHMLGREAAAIICSGNYSHIIPRYSFNLEGHPNEQQILAAEQAADCYGHWGGF
jgi:hypothetical protein